MQDKVVFITGASSGIGAACAEGFAKLGAKLVLCARRVDLLQALAERLEAQYQTSILALPLDVRDRQAVLDAFAQIDARFEGVDVLVNNAGLAAGKETVATADVADWEQMIDTNVKGLLYVTQPVLQRMLRREQGHIINISSISGHRVYPGGSVYCATKHAVDAITRAMKMELKGTRLRVTSIDPGAADTEFSLVRFKGDKAKADQIYHDMQPLSAEDVADAVIYCATRPPHVDVANMILLPTDQVALN